MGLAYLTPEARLVMAAAMDGPAGEASSGRDLAALIRPDLDWAVVAHLAVREKVASIVWRAVRSLGDAVPSDAAEAFSRLDLIHQFRTASFAGALTDVLRRLSAEGVQVMLLKGAALGHTVYAEPADRPMDDVDILLRPEHTERGWRILRDAGWRPESEGSEAFYDGHHHMLPLVDPRGGQVVVEIHRGLADAGTPFEPPAEALWRDAVPVSVAGEPAWALAPVEQLYHLCIHFAWSHLLARGLVRTIRDCHALLAGRDVDWDAFLALARGRRASALCFWTLELAHRLGGPLAPAEAMRRLRADGGVRLVEPLARCILAGALPTPRVHPPSVALTRIVWSAATRPRRNAPGARRPWEEQRTPEPDAADERGKVPAFAERLLSIGARAPMWWRYTRQVVGGG